MTSWKAGKYNGEAQAGKWTYKKAVHNKPNKNGQFAERIY
jgi:hypothetical protein